MSQYIPNTEADRRRMLDAVSAGSVDELFQTIPDSLRLDRPLDLPRAHSEMELLAHARCLADRNADLGEYVSFRGAGVYDHFIPATVPAVIGRSEFSTSYTPYQPEISQGNLQSIFEFQTLVCRLTGMDVANASMYDGATALAEAAIMASAITGRSEWLVTECTNPSYREVMRTYAWASGYTVTEFGRSGIATDPEAAEGRVGENTACLIAQSPNFFGSIEDLAELEAQAHRHGALFIICFDPISLGALKPPGEYNADICVAEGQSLGIPPAFGGPLLGLFACKKEFVRQMPGRIVGATTDTEGRRGYALTLQTREQHIRRERATSNICTNEALYALAATTYLSTMGKAGLRMVAELCVQKAAYARKRISMLPGFSAPIGVKYVKEFAIKLPQPVQTINDKLIQHKMIGGLDLGRYYPDLTDYMLLCVTEKRTRQEIDRLVEVMGA